VLKIPSVIHRFKSVYPMSTSMMWATAGRWAFRRVDDTTFLSFHLPPEQDADELKISKKGGGSWKDINMLDGIYVRNLVIELIKKGLSVYCQKKGLLFCSKSYLPYFPHDLLKSDRYYFYFYDGTKSFMQVYGERKYYSPTGSERYRYHLSPSFYIFNEIDRSYSVLLRIYIRLTDLSGKCLEGRKVVSRRKRLCNDWFNDEWSKKIIGIMRFLGPHGKIEIGESDKDKLIISSHPCCWELPLSINEEALYKDPVAATVGVVDPSVEDEE
jgi:hypothetical protein